MSMNYFSYALRLSDIIAEKQDNIDWSVILPATIDYAEQRCYRELDLLNTVTRDDSSVMTPSNRNFTLPTSMGRFVTVQSINVVTPPTAATADAGTRNQLTPVSRDFLDSVWNSSTGSTLPIYFAMIDDQHIIVGPFPDNAYRVEVIGTIRPNSLSADNQTTFLTSYLPDLFFNASMVFFSQAVKERGASAQNPPELWEAAYQASKQSALSEELRKKFASGAWNSLSTPVAP